MARSSNAEKFLQLRESFPFFVFEKQSYALTPAGQLRWRFETTGRLRASARIDPEGRIYVGSQDDGLYCLSATGELLWRVEVGQDIDSTAAIGPDGTLYVGADDGGLHAFASR